MNAIFTAIFVLSAAALIIYAPAEFLPALLSGGQNALKCAVNLGCIYIVWMGLSAVAEECRLTEKAAKLLAKPCKKLFRTNDDKAVESVTMNISCNLLGIGGAATPYAVKAINAFESEGNAFAQNLLFIINATSIQLIPATVIALRAAAGSAAAHDITLPSLIATFVSTAVGAGLYFIYEHLKRKRTEKGRKTGAKRDEKRGGRRICNT